MFERNEDAISFTFLQCYFFFVVVVVGNFLYKEVSE